jgi:heme exporter protein A
MALTLTDVAVARGGLPVIEGVTLQVPSGTALILRGPNGIGKTTLLRAIAGLQPVLEGSIEGATERVAYAAHADGLKATLTVAENLDFWARLFGQSDIAPALDAFDLTSLADRAAQNLSAGQKRRLGLARLLVTGRPLWVLDEPTVSLDAEMTGRFADVLADHIARGGEALIATHIDLGLSAPALDLSPYRAKPRATLGGFDEAFA